MSLPSSKNKLYDGCKMLSKDGEFMAFCNKKRMDWYIRKNLAIRIDDKTFQLTFIPQGSGHQNDLNYYKERKLNICVVCGTSKNLTRHHIVPLAFRKHLPEDYKSANCFDIIPICVRHHALYELEAAKEKQRWFDLFNISLKDDRFKTPIELTTLIRQLSVLLFRKEQLPTVRREQLITSLSEVLPKDYRVEDEEGLLSLHEELIQKIQKYKQQYRKEYRQSNCYKKVIEAFLASGKDYYDFVFAWRSHFVKVAQPKFLSINWINEMKTKPERHRCDIIS